MNNNSPTKVKLDTKENKQIKILVVEDEPDARMLFKTLIELHTDYGVLEASDGISALEVLKNDAVELILLDIVMPNMDGIEVLKNIKENREVYGDPVIVILTNLASEEAEQSSKQFGADGYLMKINIEPDDLVEKIHRFLNLKK